MPEAPHGFLGWVMGCSGSRPVGLAWKLPKWVAARENVGHRSLSLAYLLAKGVVMERGSLHCRPLGLAWVLLKGGHIGVCLAGVL